MKSIDDCKEFFAQLYCQDKGIKYDKNSVFNLRYANLGNCNSYLEINWDENGIKRYNQIKIEDALNLIAKYILTKDKKK